MTQLFEIKVKLSDNQKKNISDAYRKRESDSQMTPLVEMTLSKSQQW